ncbi:MAG: amino acid decarboxylase [Gemmatimonadales bacterium]|nr:MAG: amino acid decarboxylase [Gemmatimonadales bacterium]
MSGREPQVGDMDPEAFRRWGREVVDWIAGYMATREHLPVLSRSRPGDLRSQLPGSPPEEGEDPAVWLEDFQELILPGVTHWNHPGFLAYFAISGSGPGVLGEMLAAALNVNGMLWRTSPAATELEEHVVGWLAQLLGLPGSLFGVIQDTASSSSFAALAAARHQAFPQVRAQGLTACAPGRVYASTEAHSSIEKAVIALGLGQAGLTRIPTDADFRMRPDALERAMAEDVARGIRPVAVVATLGTTSTTSLDPLAELLPIARRHGVWVHVDAAYGGAAAALPELRHHFKGWDEADSIVVNPHKWLFTPVDCSVLFTRRRELLRESLSLVPEYLRSNEEDETTQLMDYGLPLGRRFRALKLWFVLRHFGARGIRERLAYHLELGQRFAALVDDEPQWVRVAPVPFSTVVFRWAPDGVDRDLSALDEANRRIMDAVNARGQVFLSHTSLGERTCLRMSVGNLETRWRHLETGWAQLVEEAERVRREWTGGAQPPESQDPRKSPIP